MGEGSDDAGAEAGSGRRRKKRGGANRNKQQEAGAPSHLHLMYHEGVEGEPSREREVDERDVPDA
jgi:hypothetical protein